MNNTNSMMNGGSDDEIDLRDLWNLLRRNLLLIGGVTAVAGGIAALYSITATPIYEASASIRIDEEQSNLPVLDVLSMMAGGSEVDTEMEVLRSRTLAEGVMDSVGLRIAVTEPTRVRRSELFDYVHVAEVAPEGIYTIEREGQDAFSVSDEDGEPLGTFRIGERVQLPGAAVVLAPTALEHDEIEIEVREAYPTLRGLREAIGISRPNRDANVVVVRYEHSDLDLVQRVPNELTRQFIARRQEERKIEARSTVEFLKEQIDTLANQLTAAEEALRSFREGSQVVNLVTESSAQISQLAELQAERNQLDSERAALEALLNEVRNASDGSGGAPSPYRRLIAFPPLFRNQAATELLRSLSVAESERTALLSRRTLQDPDVQVLTERVEDLEGQLRGLVVTYLQGLTNQVTSLDATLARFGNEIAEIPAKEIQLARLTRQSTVLEEIYTLLQTRLKEAQIAEAVVDPSVRVVDPAATPVEPIKPKKVLNVLLGLILGGMLGVAVAFTREFMDTTVHTKEDAQAVTGAPILGLIPRIQTEVGARAVRRGRTQAALAENGLAERLVAGRDPRNPVSEAYRSLRTNITFSSPERAPKTLVFTSPMPGDGKSTTAANLAITMAQQGLHVLLVDADMRRGVTNEVFGIAREPGLSNILLGSVDLTEAVGRVELNEDVAFDVLPTGILPPNPAELLGSQRMRALIEGLEAEYDLVVFDAPPLNLVTDAALLGTNADGVLIVARASKTNKAALAYAMEQLRHVRVTALGVVLNDVDYKRDARYYGKYGSYGYQYQYYYGNDEKV